MVETQMTLDKQEAGIAAYQHGDFAAALRLFQPLAEHGDASAQCNLGVMYEQGRGVAQNYREAMRWFRLAALQGDASAQSNLGVMYYKGQGIAQDYGEARKWYRMAAEQRNPEAQFNLGVMYARGQGVPRDDASSLMWMAKAAKLGDAAAQYSLGMTQRRQSFGKTPVATESRIESYKWFQLAAAQGYADSELNRDSVGLGLSREDVAEGARRAAEFVIGPPKI